MNVEVVINEKYQIEKEIKRGGFGIIYQATDQNLGKKVAIKAIDPQLLGEAKYIDMFKLEALNIARLNHQNIVQVFDIEREVDGQIYIVMEFIAGFDLMTLLRACSKANIKLPMPMVAYIIAEVCNGLDYVHKRRDPDTNQPMSLVHKDISPANIMVSLTGEIKVIDFGMSNLRQARSEKSNEIRVQGNIRYLAPEQIKKSGQVDHRTDIFSLGVVLFELLTGERLVPSTNKREILEDVLLNEYDLTRLYNDEIPERVQQVAHKALQHNTANRYDTANQMYRDLMHYLIQAEPTADFMNDLSEFVQKIQPGILKEAAEETKEESFSVPEKKVQKSGNGQAASERSDSASSNGKGATSDEPESVAAETTHDTEASPDATESEIVIESGEAEEPDSVKETEKNDSLVQDPEKEPESADYYSFVDDSDEVGQKTIIDVVRLSARTHKKAITATLVALVVSLIGFTAVDTFAHMTPIGTTIYDFFFPPAIKIVSIPSGASVYLDDKLLDKPTPLSLDEITPGVHKLMLTLPQYESIVKSISVPRKGTLHLSGEAKRHGSQPYILQFKTQFDVVSEPSGADIIIDGVKMVQKTPATIFWDVTGEPTNIELELAGLPTLSGLSINSMTDEEYVSDKRLWKLNKPIDGKAHYVIEGIFHKNITIDSIPRMADIYLDGSERPVGITSVNGSMMLRIGQHSFTLKKEGYHTNSFALEINEETPSAVKKDLTRNVRIFAKDVFSGDDKDLKAKLVDVWLNSQRISYNTRTPALVKLLPYTYKAKLRKKGYHDLTIDIHPEDKSVVAKMQPLYHDLTVEVVDAITGSPIDMAQITYTENGQNGAGEKPIGITGRNGQVSAKLIPGSYRVKVLTRGYEEQHKSVTLRADAQNRLIFRLAALR